METKELKWLILFFQEQLILNRMVILLTLEGKLQKAYKASYPPEDAKEDWVNN